MPSVSSKPRMPSVSSKPSISRKPSTTRNPSPTSKLNQMLVSSPSHYPLSTDKRQEIIE